MCNYYFILCLNTLLLLELLDNSSFYCSSDISEESRTGKHFYDPSKAKHFLERTIGDMKRAGIIKRSSSISNRSNNSALKCAFAHCNTTKTISKCDSFNYKINHWTTQKTTQISDNCFKSISRTRQMARHQFVYGQNRQLEKNVQTQQLLQRNIIIWTLTFIIRVTASMNEQNSSLHGPKWELKHQNPNSNVSVCECREWDLPDEIALQCFSTMSSWSVLAVRAARLWSVCMCVWLMSVRACPKVLGGSREQCGCLWFPDGLYCGGRWYVFLRKGPSRPFSPSYATDPPPPTPPVPHSPRHPHPGDPYNYTNCMNCTVKEERVGQSIPLQCFVFSSAHTCLCVCMHVCGCASCPDRFLLEVENELWGWFSVHGLESKFHSYTISSVFFLSGRL